MTLQNFKTMLHDTAAKIIVPTPTVSRSDRLLQASLLIGAAVVVIAWCALLAYGVFRLSTMLFG
jgi:hypothetical protein